MYKVGIIGDRESVLGFRAVGFDVADVTDGEAARHALESFAKQFYAIVFITEQYAEQLSADIDAFKDTTTPAVIVIPNNSGTNGMGMLAIKKSVERAVGADILFNN